VTIATSRTLTSFPFGVAVDATGVVTVGYAAAVGTEYRPALVRTDRTGTFGPPLILGGHTQFSMALSARSRYTRVALGQPGGVLVTRALTR